MDIFLNEQSNGEHHNTTGTMITDFQITDVLTNMNYVVWKAKKWRYTI